MTCTVTLIDCNTRFRQQSAPKDQKLILLVHTLISVDTRLHNENLLLVTTVFFVKQTAVGNILHKSLFIYYCVGCRGTSVTKQSSLSSCLVSPDPWDSEWKHLLACRVACCYSSLNIWILKWRSLAHPCRWINMHMTLHYLSFFRCNGIFCCALNQVLSPSTTNLCRFCNA